MNSPTRSAAGLVLGVPPEAPPGDAAAAFLASLPACGFVPAQDRCAALNVLMGASVAFDPTQSDPQFDLNARVDEFATRYWELPPQERRVEWEALHRFAGPVIPVRLPALEPGLDVPVRELYDPMMHDLAVILRELFVLPARTRSERRNTWLLSNAANHPYHCDAAKGLARLHPDLAALDPVLMSRLKTDFAVAAFVAGENVEPTLAMMNEEEERASVKADFERRLKQSAKPQPGDATPTSGRVASSVILIVVVVILRGLTGSSSPRTPSSPPDTFDPPSLPGLSNLNSPQTFSLTEVLEFREHERSRKPRPPARYSEWVEAGRPGVKLGTSSGAKVRFSQADIKECQEHVGGVSARVPPMYAQWVLAGKPLVAGEYTLR